MFLVVIRSTSPMVNHLASISFRICAVLTQFSLAFVVQFVPLGLFAMDLNWVTIPLAVCHVPMSASCMMLRDDRVLIALLSGTCFPSALATLRTWDSETSPHRMYEQSVDLSAIFGSKVIMTLC